MNEGKEGEFHPLELSSACWWSELIGSHCRRYQYGSWSHLCKSRCLSWSGSIAVTAESLDFVGSWSTPDKFLGRWLLSGLHCIQLRRQLEQLIDQPTGCSFELSWLLPQASRGSTQGSLVSNTRQHLWVGFGVEVLAWPLAWGIAASF